MHVTRLFLGALLAMVMAGTVSAATAMAPTIVTPDATKWVAGTGSEKGTWSAVLMGDPTKSGPYIMRLKLPANYSFPPHTHAGTENVTIISGSAWFGLGSKMDKAKMKEFPAGTFVSIPAKLPHYAATKQETVLQLEGVGPYTVDFVK